MYFLSQLIHAITSPLRALLSSPGKLFAPFRRLLGISLPAKLVWLTAFLLVVSVVAVLVAAYAGEDRPTVDFYGLRWWWIGIFILVVTIPIVVYYTAKLWLAGDISPYPDIEHAWKTGLAELQRQGLDISQTPMFLVLGTAGENHERSLFGASRLDFNVQEVPKGPGALHWYANPDGIYLVCTQAGCLSRLSVYGREAVGSEPGFVVPSAPPAAAGPGRGTIVLGGDEMAAGAIEESGAAPDESPPEPIPQPNIRGTMMVSSDAAISADDGAGVSGPAEKRVIRLEQQEANQQDRRLQYLCQLIRRERQPLCPINGVLTLLPFGLIQRSRPEATEVQRAVKKDISTLLRVLMLRCPINVLVVGLEEEEGFQELVRRVGRDRAAGQRFGKGFSLTNPPIAERLQALCAHACGSFEDCVYALFRERDSLSKPGNTRLYSLLVKIRRRVQGRLADVLTGGYGIQGNGEEPAGALLFGGCYFAATGATEDRQAFVRGVFDKLPEQQEEVEWTEDALRQDRRFQQYAQSVLLLDTLLLVGIVAIIVFKWFPFW